MISRTPVDKWLLLAAVAITHKRGSPVAENVRAIGLQRCSCHPHPRRTSFPDGIEDTIIHLNDSEEWPRERIADWLENLGL